MLARHPQPNGDSPPKNGNNSQDRQPALAGIEQMIDEAEQLRGLMNEADARLARLTGALKQYRRQSKAFQQAVSSLRQFNLGA